MTKWDRYRRARENAIDEFVKLFFRMKKVTLIIALIQTQKVQRKLCEDFTIWQEQNMYNLNKLFLAIKFKVRFRERFYKKYGYDFHNRINKYVIRHFSLYGPMFKEVRAEKSHKIVEWFLQKYYVTSNVIRSFTTFYRNVLEMQRLYRKIMTNKAIR